MKCLMAVFHTETGHEGGGHDSVGHKGREHDGVGHDGGTFLKGWTRRRRTVGRGSTTKPEGTSKIWFCGLFFCGKIKN